MKNRRRKFYPGTLQHIYQQSADKGVIFYSDLDYLVFFTIVCSVALEYDVKIVAIVPMPDHYHELTLVASLEELARFHMHYPAEFALEYNRHYERKGRLLKKSFGSAPKYGNKAVRTALAYNYNNPAERKLCTRVDEWRWNFLAYANNPFPFSRPFNPKRARKCMKRAVAEVKAIRKSRGYLNYAVLERLFAPLSEGERQQLTDVIIGTWSVIDYEYLISFYGDYQTMLRAFNSNTGAEFEIKEERGNYDDRVYSHMTERLQADGIPDPPRTIYKMSEAARRKMAIRLSAFVPEAHPKQIAKYLHL